MFKKLFNWIFGVKETPYTPIIGDIVSLPGEPIGFIKYEVMALNETEPKLNVRMGYYAGYPAEEGTRMDLYTKSVTLRKRKK